MNAAELDILARNLNVEKGANPDEVVLKFHENVENRLTDYFGNQIDDEGRIFRLRLLLELANSLRGNGTGPDPTILW